MAAAGGAEERTAWPQPVDLIALRQRAALELPHLFAARCDASGWSDHATLSESLLADDPAAIIDALTVAARHGASPADLGRALAYAAALRVARFGAANEHSDWETAHHVFTYANAVHQALKRIGGEAVDVRAPVEAVRGLLHGAMALYLARYLNVPPDVRVIADKAAPCGRASGLEPLTAAGVPIWIGDRPRLAHAKTMVVDGTVTLMGSYNWTRGALENSEDLNLVSSPTAAAAYTTRWRQRLTVSVRFDRRGDWCRVSSAEAR